MSMYEYKPTNRDKKRKVVKLKFWCKHCDTQLSSKGSKCPNCGYKLNTKRIKRD